MSKLLLLLTFLSCAVFGSTWDIALTTGEELDFYSSNGSRIAKEAYQFTDVTALAYEAVQNILFFVDNSTENASIFSFNPQSQKFQPLVRRQEGQRIMGLAFDPVTGILFWTDSNNRSIYWISLAPGSKDNGYGKVLVSFDEEIPSGIAVDSCRGYLYWSIATPTAQARIERSKLDGTEREIVINSDIYLPVSIAIDHDTQRLFWADDREGIHYSIESSDLNGKNRKTILKGQYHQPYAITVSNDYIFWSDLGFHSIWSYSKWNNEEKEPTKFINFDSDHKPLGLVANYNLTERANKVPECQRLKEIIANKKSLENNFKGALDNDDSAKLFCLHGEQIPGKPACKCDPGYKGFRCEISLCHNYCFSGYCIVNKEGNAKCRCKVGFTGERCEIDTCSGYCLNSGVCTRNEILPTCQCPSGYQGVRCEEKQTNSSCNCTRVDDLPNSISSLETLERRNYSDLAIEDPTSLTYANPTGCLEEGWSIKETLLVILVGICFMLIVLTAVLVTKVMHLKRRPRIRKTIRVNKNVTPLTARPDAHCEITIENCCNMNICETPCFEPRTIKPSLFDVKPGKEEKRNLIANMEHADDF